MSADCAAPLSRADLFDVDYVIRNLYRAVESPEADRSWLPDAVQEIGNVADLVPPLSSPEARKLARALANSPPQLDHPQMIRVAGLWVLHRLFPSGNHVQNCAHISESLLDLQQKTALLDLVQDLRHPFFGDHLAGNRALALGFLSKLDDVLRSIGGTAASRIGRAVEGPETANPTATRPKRSTERGEARRKIIAAMTESHQFDKGGCLNTDSIGVNDLARKAGVAPSTVTKFFNDEFDGHDQYRALCRRSPSELVTVLKMLRGEHSPRLLYNRISPKEGRRDDE
jgi:hypothetical protein